MLASPSREAIAAAVQALDLGDLAGRRWYAAKGEAPRSASLAHAFAVSDTAMLALVDLRVGEGSGRAERYAIPFVLDAGRVASRMRACAPTSPCQPNLPAPFATR